MEQMEFNLLDEPWIRVMTEDCTVVERSLMQVLLNSHRYQRLAGELPTQDVALLRLLLAILQTVFYRVDPEGEDDPIEDRAVAIRRWQALWNVGRFPEQPIRTYLETWKDRFWLFHPEHPFYQVPAAAVGTAYTAAKLNGELSESSNKVRLFPVRAGSQKAHLSYAESARWLLYLNGFDDTSAKPKGKCLPSPGAGWLGKLGLFFAEGSTLFETLMLNLVLLREDRTIWTEPHPVWERERPKCDERTEIVIPDNQAELLTLQSRRLLLERDENGVSGYRLLGGDFFQKINATAEQMTVWERRKGKANEPPYDQPKRMDPDRLMWRDFGIITGAEGTGRAPGIVSWITLLKKERVLERDQMIHFRTAGVKYGDKDFFVEDILRDYLDFRVDLLDDGGKIWSALIGQEIEKTERAAWFVGKLAEGIFKAEGGLPDSATQAASVRRAAQEFYAAVDLPFRNWLCSIDPVLGDTEELRAEKALQWHETGYRIALQQGKQMVRNAGESAFTGRWIKDKKTDRESFLSSSTEYDRFVGSVRKCFQITRPNEEVADE